MTEPGPDGHRPGPGRPLTAEELLAHSNKRWAEFEASRRTLAEVMTDDDLRALGINVDVLDSRP